MKNTFVIDAREEMTRIEPTCENCNKAALSALVRIDGTIYLSGAGKYRIEISTDFGAVGRFITANLHTIYDLKTNLSYRRSVLHHTQNYQIDIPYQEGIENALRDLCILDDNNSIVRGVSPKIVPNKCCKLAYLRGVFMGSDFIGDPKSAFHFEASVNSEDMAKDVVGFMKEFHIQSRVVKRRNSWMIYMKSGEEISKFLATVGAHTSATKLEEARVMKSLRNDINRTVNAEIANQNRASAAAYEQLQNIAIVLKKHKDLEGVPPAIADFIRLRVANPDASMKELGELSDPPLTKSAINHRARRLEELARESE